MKFATFKGLWRTRTFKGLAAKSGRQPGSTVNEWDVIASITKLSGAISDQVANISSQVTKTMNTSTLPQSKFQAICEHLRYQDNNLPANSSICLAYKIV